MTGESYLEVLTQADCVELLPTSPVGWLAYCHASRPELVLVNFAVADGEVVARTSYGSKLAAAAHGLVMSLGVSEVDPQTRMGWSVTVTGRGRLVGHVDDLPDETLVPGLQPYAPGDKDFYIGIPLDDVSGRRIHSRGR